MNYEAIARDKKAFDEAHGGNPVQITGWLVYADGARREIAQLSVMYEPPEDYNTRRKLILQYYGVLLQQAVVPFMQMKRDLESYTMEAERTRHLPFPHHPPGESEFKELRALAAEAKKRRKKYEEVEAQLEAEKPEHLRRREHVSAEHQENIARARDELKKIRI